MTPEFVPLPLQPSTRTATSVTPLATPQVLPPTVPAHVRAVAVAVRAAAAVVDRGKAVDGAPAELRVRAADAGIDDVRPHA